MNSEYDRDSVVTAIGILLNSSENPSRATFPGDESPNHKVLSVQQHKSLVSIPQTASARAAQFLDYPYQ